MKAETYRPDIDGLRALAVVSVVGFHGFPARVPGGFIGVDVFFVISGFLISGIILRGIEARDFSIWGFYARRIRRIFPALTTVLLVTLVLGWHFLLPVEYVQLATHTIAGASFVSNLVLWAETGYFGPGAAALPLLHLWSLGIEEQFYLIWPILFIFVVKFENRIALILVIVVTIASFSLNILYVAQSPEAAFYLPIMRFWELMIGGALAMQVRHGDLPGAIVTRVGLATGKARMLKTLFSLSGGILLIASVALITKDSTFPGWWALMPVFATALIIAAGQDAWINRVLLSNRLVTHLGLISYPLYLWHWPMLYMVTQTLESGSVAEYRIYRIAAIVLSLLLAQLTFIWLERPLKEISAAKVAPKLSIALALVALLAYCVIATNGALQIRYKSDEIEAYHNLESERKVRDSRYRYGQCLLVKAEYLSEFSPICYPVIQNDIALLGDSYAAHLYPGLAALGQGVLSIAQLTASACPPVENFAFPDRPNCNRLNAEILKHVQKNPPKTLVFAANWPLYWHLPGFEEHLHETLRRVKTFGHEKLILVGPAVTYPIDQLSWVIRKGDIGREDSTNPRLFALRQIDNALSAISKDLNIDYVSPIKALCTQEICKYVILVNGERRLLASDQGHLTADGSRFYAERLLLPHIPLSAKFLR